MSKIEVKVDKLPPCDFCAQMGIHKSAEYDFVTRMGPWANGCFEHWYRYRSSDKLGTGIGQKLVTK